MDRLHNETCIAACSQARCLRRLRVQCVDLLARFFGEHHIHVITGMEMNSNEAIKQGVQAGLGLGIVSVHTVALEVEVERLAVLDVMHMPIIRNWYIVHRKDKRLSPVAQAFKSFVLKEARQLLELQLNHDPARLAPRKAAKPRLKAVKN